MNEFQPLFDAPDRIGEEVNRFWAMPWRPAANRMFTEWRDTESPHVCTLAWLRFMEACEKAVATLSARRWPKSYVLRLPYLSNGIQAKHYERRVTLADFQ